MTADKLFNLAFRYLSRSAKTEMQMRNYLKTKHVDTYEIETVVSRLIELGYIDDKAFAGQFIENRIRFKPKSVFALGYELRQKGVDAHIADELLSSYDDLDLALKALETKQDQWRHLDENNCQKKVMNYLRYRGFGYGVCQLAWETFLTEF